MNLAVLRTELATDPETRGYSGMTDAEAAADLNTEYRERNVASLTGSQIFNAIVKSAYDGLDATQKETLWRILHLGTINPFGNEADIMIDLFGGGSATITALAALRKEDISRAVELGLGRVRTHDVTRARS